MGHNKKAKTSCKCFDHPEGKIEDTPALKMNHERGTIVMVKGNASVKWVEATATHTNCMAITVSAV